MLGIVYLKGNEYIGNVSVGNYANISLFVTNIGVKT
jgi:hypothetical protein